MLFITKHWKEDWTVFRWRLKQSHEPEQCKTCEFLIKQQKVWYLPNLPILAMYPVLSILHPSLTTKNVLLKNNLWNVTIKLPLSLKVPFCSILTSGVVATSLTWGSRFELCVDKLLYEGLVVFLICRRRKLGMPSSFCLRVLPLDKLCRDQDPMFKQIDSPR